MYRWLHYLTHQFILYSHAAPADCTCLGDLDAAAADLLGIKGERVRCFSVPHMEKKFGLAVHMYIDLQVTGALRLLHTLPSFSVCTHRPPAAHACTIESRPVCTCTPKSVCRG